MRIFLVKDISNLGNMGEVIEVKPGFARNYLLPQKLAVLPNSLEAKEILEKIHEKKIEKEKVLKAKEEKKIEKENKNREMKARKMELLAKNGIMKINRRANGPTGRKPEKTKSVK